MTFSIRVFSGEQCLLDRPVTDREITRLRIGTRAWMNLLSIQPDSSLPRDTRLDYDLGLAGDNDPNRKWIRDWAPHLCPDGRKRPGFTLKSKLDRILHGSCRRPHHPAGDGLVRVDEELGKAEQLEDIPSLLLMTGDQIYADDVAGPMLHAIHCVIHQLGLYQEILEGASLSHSRELTSMANAYYHRDALLPES